MSGMLPVLVLAFNRPAATERLLRRVAEIYDPRRIYVAVDGPRPGRDDDRVKVGAVRALARRATGDDSERLLLRERNLGCMRAVSGAISWFFRSESAGIILEDDIEPSAGFFDFCEHGLRAAALDPALMHVGGSLIRPPRWRPRAPASRTTYPHVWGWATTRAAWASFDPGILARPPGELRALIHRAVRGGRARLFYRLAFSLTRQGKLDSWAYRWVASVWRAGGHALVPSENLVINRGFGTDSTHTWRNREAERATLGEWTPPASDHPAPFDHELSEGMHCLGQGADSWLKLVRMSLSVPVPAGVFRNVRRRWRGIPRTA